TTGVYWTTCPPSFAAVECGSGNSRFFRLGNRPPTHPNGSLIRIPYDGHESSNTVYVLYQGQLVPIPDQHTLNVLYGVGYGFDFRDVITVAADELSTYTVNNRVSLPLPNNNYVDATGFHRHEPDGRLIRQRNGPEIAIVTNHGQRLPFATQLAFYALGYLDCNIATVDDYTSYPRYLENGHEMTVEDLLPSFFTIFAEAELVPEVVSHIQGSNPDTNIVVTFNKDMDDLTFNTS